jgi:hypothetical protein
MIAHSRKRVNRGGARKCIHYGHCAAIKPIEAAAEFGQLFTSSNKPRVAAEIEYAVLSAGPMPACQPE